MREIGPLNQLDRLYQRRHIRIDVRHHLLEVVHNEICSSDACDNEIKVSTEEVSTEGETRFIDKKLKMRLIFTSRQKPFRVRSHIVRL